METAVPRAEHSPNQRSQTPCRDKPRTGAGSNLALFLFFEKPLQVDLVILGVEVGFFPIEPTQNSVVTKIKFFMVVVTVWNGNVHSPFSKSKAAKHFFKLLDRTVRIQNVVAIEY